MLYPADEGQKPETAVQGLHLLSFGISNLIFFNGHVYLVQFGDISTLHTVQVG